MSSAKKPARQNHDRLSKDESCLDDKDRGKLLASLAIKKFKQTDSKLLLILCPMPPMMDAKMYLSELMFADIDQSFSFCEMV